MSTGITCQLYVDGVRVADGSPGDDPLAPTALSGLSFAWGRPDTTGQPDPATLQFTLVDDPGGSSFVGSFRTGMSVEVTATGKVSGDPDQSTVLDPSFDTTPPGQLPGNVRTDHSGVTVQLYQDTRSALRLQPTDAEHSHGVLVAPAPFSALPDAWDAIPTTDAGQTWQVTVQLLVPAGATATMQPVLIYDTAGRTVRAFGAPVKRAGTGAWDAYSTRAVPPDANAWVGVRVTVYPTGLAWQDAPGTWEAQVGSWLDLTTVWLDDVEVLAPGAVTERTVLAFAGRITDLEAGFDGSPVIEVTAADFTADLENTRVGDEPWLAEPFATRFRRVLDLSGLDVESIIDTGVAAVPLSWQDVDSQPVGGLLKDYSQSVDAVLWPAVHATTGPYLRVEDQSERPAVYVLERGSSQWELTRQNLIQNPSFEVSLDGWVASGGASFSRVNSGAQAGAWAAQVPATNSAISGDIRLAGGGLTQLLPGLVPGHTYTVTASVTYAAAMAGYSTDTTSRQRRILFFFSRGTTWIPNHGPQAPNQAGTFRLQHTFTVPLDAVGTILGVGCAGSAVGDAGTLQWVDAVLLEETTTVGSFFDGDTPDTETERYSWTGAAGLSVSQQETGQAGWVEIVPAPVGVVQELSACDVLRDPVSWVQSVADVATGVDVTWLEQGTDGEGNPATTERHVKVIDADLEAQYGFRRMGVSTVLSAQTDALATANRLLARTSFTGWRAAGLTVGDDTLAESADSTAVEMILRLLDGTTRNGLPVLLTDLPAWSPLGVTEVGVYLEGGTYSFIEGGWELQLTVSAGQGQGASVTWAELDRGWAWNEFDPAIAWADLYGVGPEPEGT